jgi:hypothetical protein
VMMDDYVQRDGTGWRHVPADAHHSCRRFAREDIQAVLNAAAAPGRALPDENVWFPDPAEPPPPPRPRPPPPGGAGWGERGGGGGGRPPPPAQVPLSQPEALRQE